MNRGEGQISDFSRNQPGNKNILVFDEKQEGGIS